MWRTSRVGSGDFAVKVALPHFDSRFDDWLVLRLGVQRSYAIVSPNTTIPAERKIATRPLGLETNRVANCLAAAPGHIFEWMLLRVLLITLTLSACAPHRLSFMARVEQDCAAGDQGACDLIKSLQHRRP
jgi:hypothetical protein